MFAYNGQSERLSPYATATGRSNEKGKYLVQRKKQIGFKICIKIVPQIF
jgi:hypothetical protein